MARAAVRRAFIILGCIAAVIAGLLLLAQDQDTLKIRSGVDPDDPGHTAYVAALVGADLTRANRFDVLTNGEQLIPAMLEAIRGAKRRISFETYIYDTGKVPDMFTTAFEDAARRGVRVNMVVDAVGGSSMEDAHVKRLEAAGVKVAWFNTPTWYALEELNYRTHRKILVVDGEIGFTGGAGIADHWQGNARNPEEWRDTHIRMFGPIVRLLEAGFYENFVEAAGEVAPVFDDAPEEMDLEGRSFVIRSSPTGGANELKRLYLLAIASSRRTLDITTPYFVTDESSRWAFADAVKRGVKVRLLVEGNLTDAMPVKYASRDAYELLLGQGIEIYEYQPTMLHTKTFVIDGTMSIFGSANFDNRSLELNDELNVAVTSKELAGRLLADFEQDLRVAQRVDLETWKKRSFLKKTRENFWSFFGEIF